MKRNRVLVLVAFGLAVTLAMGASIRGGFVYDDLPAIVHNLRVTDRSQWHTIFRSPYWLGTLWRPLTVTLFAAQWLLGHGAPWLFHLTSLLGYLGVGILLFQLLLQLGIHRTPATIATVLFLVHPVHVEAVANGVGQAELWTALALIGATLLYLRARQYGTERRSFPALLIVVALGIMSKEQGFIAPLLLGGAEWLLCGGRRDPLRARIRLLVPITALTALLFVLRGALLNSMVGETPAIALRALDPAGRAVTFLGVIPEWARLILWPAHLQADYGPPGIPVGGPIALRHGIGLVLAIGFVMLFLWSRRRAPAAAFGLLWAAIALAPVSNLLTPTGIVMAERVLFVPTIGLAMAITVLLSGMKRRAQPIAVAAIAIALVLTVRSAMRVPTWSSQERFFTDITLDGPLAYRGWKVAADYWDAAGDRPRAIADLKHAIALWPHDYEVAERLGQILRQDGHCDAAIPIFSSGLEADPTASSLRAKLVECLIVRRDWDRAGAIANGGVTLGQQEFVAVQERIARLHIAADSAARSP